MELETERLILREYFPDDWEAVLTHHSDPRYQRFYPIVDRSVGNCDALESRRIHFWVAPGAEE